MATQNKVQTAPLAYTGVPESQMVAAPSPIPTSQLPQPPQQQFVPQPQDQAAIEQEAIARDQALQAAAQQAYPDQNAASILSVLSGIAGNIAGTINGRGAVGNPGIELAGRIQQQQQAQQQNFIDRARQEEIRIRDQQAKEEDRQGRELRAQSLYPLISKIPDKELRGALQAQITAGDVNGAQEGYRMYQQDRQRQEAAALNADLRKQYAEIAESRLDLAKQKNERDDARFKLLSGQQQQKIIDNDVKTFAKKIDPIQDAIVSFDKINALIGGVDSAQAQDLLDQVAGFKPIVASGPLANKKQAQLLQNLTTLFNSWGQAISGKVITESESERLERAFGFNFVKDRFNPAKLKGKINIQEGLKVMRDVLDNRLNSAQAEVRPEAVALYESRGGLSPRQIKATREVVGQLGPVDLDVAPSSNPEIARKWSTYRPYEKIYVLKRLRGLE